jgi:hypothetical protein
MRGRTDEYEAASTSATCQMDVGDSQNIYKWPSPPQPSQEEEQKIAVGREKALDLIKKQWMEIKEKSKKNVRDGKDNHIKKYSRSTGKN